ncbi:hypothetical protein FBALC1_09282 [Flavobacteriales bacterium ALC-1]|nr:hypothetical protein FBALC1_09282 [Flavobacteriales bacterium ALC-1]
MFIFSIWVKIALKFSIYIIDVYTIVQIYTNGFLDIICTLLSILANINIFFND